ncbi:MAG: hypothetical protein C3F06_00055 [Candidatus Methanoperedenaceae archaeon]|nr:MAG: hypothetical protein C3F06_00055 [Candidatus Methanoperedenaceae archaeon]
MRHSINIFLLAMLVLISTIYTVEAGNIGMEVIDTVSTLQGTSITIVSPNGGENWVRGTTYTIKWNRTGSIGTRVKIELFRGSTLSRTISSSTSNDGTYSWTIPSSQKLDSNYKIRITSRGNPSYTDTSDNSFTISGQSITVISPNGGENWVRETNHNINWNRKGSTGTRVKIELFRGSTLSRTISSSTSNDGSYSWTIPSSQKLDSNYKIRITGRSNPSYTDTSDNSFTISDPSILSYLQLEERIR